MMFMVWQGWYDGGSEDIDSDHDNYYTDVVVFMVIITVPAFTSFTVWFAEPWKFLAVQT